MARKASLTNKNYNNIKNWEETTHTYKGIKNNTMYPAFVNICKKTQEELKEILPVKLLENGYDDIVVGDGYIYAKGTVPVLLTAHMDTVHSIPVIDYYEDVDEEGNHILSSPQGIGGDDRCGVYMILEIIKTHKCSVLFCEDEEIGGVGSSKFCATDLINELSELNYLIELDRANKNDAVFYDCNNPEFTKFICKTTGYKEAWGSFSDISWLCPTCKIAGVNLSCGYYAAHTTMEKVVVEEMLNTIEVVKKLLDTESVQYEYIEHKWNYRAYDDYDYYGRACENYYGYSKGTHEWGDVCMSITWEENGQEKEDVFTGYDENDCLVLFFQNNPNVSWNQVLDYEYDYL